MASCSKVLVAAALGVCSLVSTFGCPAAADCTGPTVEYEAGEVSRGSTITVNGIAFGDNCYDTGPPPKGQRELGRPLPDIEVVMVQRAREVVVARGAADSRYEFEVDIVVPVDFEPGEARLLARAVQWGGRREAYDDTRRPVVIVDGPPKSGGAAEAATFGPTPDLDLPGSDGGDDRRGTWLLAAGAGLAGVVGALLIGRRR